MSRKKTIFWGIGLLCLAAACAAVFLGFKTAPDFCLEGVEEAPAWLKNDAGGFSDDFSSINPRWNFGDIERSGYHRLVRVDGLTAAEIGIDPVDKFGDSDCSLEEKILLRRAGVMTIRAKLSDNINDFKGGTLGFGLWNNRDGYHFDAVWFVACSKASSPGLYGFSAMVLEESRFLFSRPVSVDISKWHDYSISITTKNTTFYVDGSVVARAENINAARSCKCVVAWVDNKMVDLYATSHKIEYMPVPEKCFMLIDKISWKMIN